ncbi:hypothetical protein ACFLU6_09310 [Acidobacteriota bacterium]
MRLRHLVVLLAFVVFIPAFIALGGTATHLNQSPDDHVVLEVYGTGEGGCEWPDGYMEFRRNLPDGTAEPGPFRVPEGKLLVITDLDWQFRSQNGSADEGRMAILTLVVENIEDGSDRRHVDSTITLSSQGEGGISESMATGIVVSSEARICPDISPLHRYVQHIILRGYFIDDKRKAAK